MLFKKFFSSLLFLFVIFSFIFFNFSNYYLISFNYFSMRLDSVVNYPICFFMDKNSLIFIFMVCLVTCLVSFYSEVYMEHYNNKKFFFLMFLFFMFMSLLSISGSFIVFLVGWDGLGLSSICLIMFYPNKNTLYNSILTMVFNRLGDVILIFALCKFLQCWSVCFFLNSGFYSTILVLLIICSFTKSAQFPLSSWLPAAMSAPTPISAMVHSSTLVTAGILSTQFFISYFLKFGLNFYIVFICLLTFILGGLMASNELDKKKIIAFSTMSQISMILAFCFMNLVNIALSHMLFHAFFKTLLFVSSGVLFVYYWSKQMKNFMSFMNSGFVFLSLLFFLSIYNMSGLTFSSSFFSKDLILEIFCSMDSMFIFFFLMLGSILTMLYSIKLMKSSTSFLTFNKIHLNKNFYFYFVLIFMVFVNYSGQLYKFFMSMENFPMMLKLNLYMMNLILLSVVFFNVLNSNYSKKAYMILNMCLELFYMKYFVYSFFSTFSKNSSFQQFTLNDETIFKSYYTNLLKSLNINQKKNLYAFLMLVSTMLLAYMI